jgi:hypothetical protein
MLIGSSDKIGSSWDCAGRSSASSTIRAGQMRREIAAALTAGTKARS